MRGYLGEIRMFAGTNPPNGWAFCDGQLLNISQYNALFSILQYSYGGDGAIFAVPDFRGRFPIHKGQGPGLTSHVLGERGGSETVALLQSQMPAHNHLISANNAWGNQSNPQGNFPAITTDPNSGSFYDSFAATPNTTMNVATVSASGGSQPHDNMPPYQCVSFIICIEGINP